MVAGMVLMHVERMADHLLDRVEGIDNRHVLDDLAVAEAQEMRKPIFQFGNMLQKQL